MPSFGKHHSNVKIANILEHLAPVSMSSKHFMGMDSFYSPNDSQVVGVCYNPHYRDEAWETQCYSWVTLVVSKAEHEPWQPYSNKFKFHLISITCVSNNRAVAVFGFPALTTLPGMFHELNSFLLSCWMDKEFQCQNKGTGMTLIFFFLRGTEGNVFYRSKNFKWKPWLFKFQNCVPFMALSCHWPNGHEFKQTLGDNEGQGSLECCSPWGHKELDMT